MNKTQLTLPVAALLFSNIAIATNTAAVRGNEFNPAISLILEGLYTDIDSSDLELPGFQLGGEAGLPQNGFSTGHNELQISADIDDKFYGSMTAPIVLEEGEVILELEEAFIETLGLGAGFTVKAGQFFSGLGYLNSIHDHNHDFVDRPLVYDALFGGHLMDTGIQGRWLAPTEQYLMLGAEVLSGSSFPGGENEDSNQGSTIFAKTGGDFNESSSWQLGLAYYASEFDVREAGGHQHGGEEEEEVDNELLNGEVDVTSIDFVYKWAPNGNIKERNFKFQAEYFIRNEEGAVAFEESEDGTTVIEGTANYSGEQTGFYAQAVYQFMPMWRVGLRYDWIEADNKLTNLGGDFLVDADELEETGLVNEDDNPTRTSLMIDYSPSHFSRIRLQYSDLDNGEENNKGVMLQYLMSLGSHGAHTF